jgi:hypothetical protein
VSDVQIGYERLVAFAEIVQQLVFVIDGFDFIAKTLKGCYELLHIVPIQLQGNLYAGGIRNTAHK